MFPVNPCPGPGLHAHRSKRLVPARCVSTTVHCLCIPPSLVLGTYLRPHAGFGCPLPCLTLPKQYCVHLNLNLDLDLALPCLALCHALASVGSGALNNAEPTIPAVTLILAPRLSIRLHPQRRHTCRGLCTTPQSSRQTFDLPRRCQTASSTTGSHSRVDARVRTPVSSSQAFLHPHPTCSRYPSTSNRTALKSVFADRQSRESTSPLAASAKRYEVV